MWNSTQRRRETRILKTSKNERVMIGRRLIFAFLNGKITSRARREKKWTLNPIAAARRLMTNKAKVTVGSGAA